MSQRKLLGQPLDAWIVPKYTACKYTDALHAPSSCVSKEIDIQSLFFKNQVEMVICMLPLPFLN